MAVGVSAVCLTFAGLAFLFAGVEVTGAAFGTPVAEPFPAILGAALLGFGSMNWIARHHVLGGIYGRSVVVANQTHLVIGALILVKHLFEHGGSTALWILTLFYVAGAALFTVLLTGGGLSRKA